eukprot:1398933-Pleurochrysis_carterae.AAC.1
MSRPTSAAFVLYCFVSRQRLRAPAAQEGEELTRAFWFCNSLQTSLCFLCGSAWLRVSRIDVVETSLECV